MNRRVLAGLLVAVMLGAFVVAATAAAQDGGNVYEATDPAADVDIQTQGQGAGAPPPTAQSTDLVAFRILDENAETMLLEIQVADMRAPDSNTDSFYDPAAYIRFRAEGSAAYYHIFAHGITGGGFGSLAGDEPWYVQSFLCISNNADEPIPTFIFNLPESCYIQEIPAITFPGDDVVQILVPKLALLGVGGDGDARPGGIPDTLDAGDRLVDWRVITQKRAENLFFGFSVFGGQYSVVYRDTLPDDGVADAYTLQAPAANAEIVLRAHGGDTGVFTGTTSGITWQDIYPVTYVGIAPDQTLVVPVDAYNGADSKRLVNLTVRFPDGGADRFDVRIAPVVEVPADQNRRVNLILNVTNPLAHREMVDLEVRGASLGHDGEVGSALIRLVGNEPPDTDANTLRFHAVQDYGDTVRVGSSYTCINNCNIRMATWMNTLADDPLAEVGDEGYEANYFYGIINALFGEAIIFAAGFPLDAPLAKDLHYDPGQPVTAQLTFSTMVELDVTARLQMYGTIVADDCPQQERCVESVFLGEGTTDLTIGSDPTTADVSFILPADLNVLASAGGSLQAAIFLESDDPRMLTTGLHESANLRFHTTQSQIRLPVVADPEPEPVSDLFVSLDAAGDDEQFVNPGKTRAFHVFAINEGAEDAAIRIEASPDATTWAASVEPGDQYRLQPGQSVNVTILVTAPADAPEGNATQVKVVAHDRDGEGASRPVTLRAIATSGLDIEDQAGEVEADEDTKARLDIDDGGDSPGVGAGLILAGVFAAAILIRRRR